MNSEQIGMDKWERIEALRERQKELRERLRNQTHEIDGTVAELRDIADALKAEDRRP